MGGDELRRAGVLAPVRESGAGRLVIARPADCPVAVEDECAVRTPQSCQSIKSATFKSDNETKKKKNQKKAELINSALEWQLYEAR